MHSIEMNPSWFLSHAKHKDIFFIFTFCIDIYSFVGLAYQGKDIVFKFIIKYSSLKELALGNNRSIFI
jgi:hypothetical protein